MPRPIQTRQPPALPEASEAESQTAAEQSPLSLTRLRAAFAQMLGTEGLQVEPQVNAATSPDVPSDHKAPDPCEVSPRTVVEAMLFVGRPDGRPFYSREMAAAMRGVSPA